MHTLHIALKTHALTIQYVLPFMLLFCISTPMERNKTKLYSSYQMHLHFSTLVLSFSFCSFNMTKFFFSLLHKHISILFLKENFSLWIQFETKSILCASFSSAYYFACSQKMKKNHWRHAHMYSKISLRHTCIAEQSCTEKKCSLQIRNKIAWAWAWLTGL